MCVFCFSSPPYPVTTYNFEEDEDLCTPLLQAFLGSPVHLFPAFHEEFTFMINNFFYTFLERVHKLIRLVLQSAGHSCLLTW